MKSQEVEEFIKKNEASFSELKRIMKAVDTVRGVDTLNEMKARQKAIRIVNEWIGKLWGIAYDDLPESKEDEEVYRFNN